MTRQKRNLRLFFILLAIIVCLYVGFLWFARSTQVETARLHAEVGERLEARGLGYVLESRKEAPEPTEPVEPELRSRTIGANVEFDLLLADLKQLWQSDDYPRESTVPCECPEDFSDEPKAGDPDFFRTHEDLVVRFVNLVSRNDLPQMLAQVDPKTENIGWYFPLRTAIDLTITNIYLDLKAGDTQVAEERLIVLVHFADELAGTPFFDVVHIREMVFRAILMVANATNVAGSLSDNALTRVVSSTSGAATISDWVPFVLAQAWYADEFVDEMISVYAWGDDEVVYSPFRSRPLQKLWLRSYGPFNPAYHIDRRSYSSTLATLADLLERPYYEVINDPENPLGQLQHQSIFSPLSRVFAGATVSVSMLDQTKAQGAARVLALGLLSQDYYAERGEFPPNLDSLEWPSDIPLETIEEIQKDPFTGVKFDYSQDTSRCTIGSERLRGGAECACRKVFSFAP